MSSRSPAARLSHTVSLPWLLMACSLLVACGEDAGTPLEPPGNPPQSVHPEAPVAATQGVEIAFVSDRDFEGGREIGWGRYDVYLMATDGSDVLRVTGGVTEVNSASLSPDRTRIAIGWGDEIRIMDLTGSGSVSVVVGERAFTTVAPAWSPDGSRIALTIDEDGWFDLHVYVVNADGSNLTRLAPGAFPTWSPDGTKIAFNDMAEDGEEIWVMNVDGTNLVNITNSAGHDFWPDWSPAGNQIAFTSTRSGDYEIYVMNADGSGQVNVTNHRAFDGYPQWSPDGSRIAFFSNRAGNGEIFVMNADGSEPVNLTQNPSQDQAPAW